jgi:hypothetical protein
MIRLDFPYPPNQPRALRVPARSSHLVVQTMLFLQNCT